MELAKNDAKSRIQQYLSGEEIVLTSAEEKILARWEAVNELLIKKEKSWSEIRDFIALRFAVSKFTAENDIAHTQEVFGRLHKINKKYLIHLHLDRIDRDIEKIREGLFSYEGEDGKKYSCIPNPKQQLALAKLYDAYTYTLNSIPEEVDKSKLPPPILIFQLPAGVSIMQPLSYEAALKAADEYINFEEIKKDGSTDQQSGQSTG